jgi:hypothetical protein
LSGKSEREMEGVETKRRSGIFGQVLKPRDKRKKIKKIGNSRFGVGKVYDTGSSYL